MAHDESFSGKDFYINEQLTQTNMWTCDRFKKNPKSHDPVCWMSYFDVQKHVQIFATFRAAAGSGNNCVRAISHQYFMSLSKTPVCSAHICLGTLSNIYECALFLFREINQWIRPKLTKCKMM